MSSDLRPVPGLPGYLASRDGYVFKRNPNGSLRRLKPTATPTGHLLFGAVCPDGKRRLVRVHRAVLMAFRGKPKPGQISRHLDGEPTNNALANLKWGTQSENSDDRARHRRKYRRMTADLANAAQVLFQFGMPKYQIARTLDIDIRAVRRAVKESTQ